ncbi:MAG: Hsp70 family protein [Chloroflexota bacterium]|nr:Hsp70 family protein [Dehalococcoidia bacterium]MDW8254910.1 Hsp70 family protein [Chloroflexota bacterium]
MDKTAIPMKFIQPTSIPENIRSPIRVVGIDLGTTNSTVAEIIWRPGQAEPPIARCLEVEQPTDTGPYTHVLVPSVVAIRGSQTWVGEGAKRLRADPKLRRNKDIFYETKNDIGSRRTYHLAPEGFQSAAQIGAKILAFLKTEVEAADALPIARTVITVPASFQLSQRNDTLLAAKLAGLTLQPGDLLDEPVAAFLDYLMSNHDSLLPELDQPKNLLVFDFGGGTCDVAIFRVRFFEGHLEVAPISVSRYHRLGGGDIDSVIVHEELIPQLLEQNNIDPKKIEFDERKRHLEPALLSIAEALKIGLCTELLRLEQFNRHPSSDKDLIVKTLSGAWPCPCPGYPSLKIHSPQLSAKRFAELLKPFLDRDLLYTRETEYYLTCSIFAPLQDALDRAEINREQISLCLMVGGSSLIPQVVESIKMFLPRARILTYADQLSAQVAVARGAAYHALSVALFGRGLVLPVASDTVSIRVASGLLELVPRGALLPFPGPNQFSERLELVVPASSVIDSVPLRVELVSGEDQRPLFTAIWDISGPVNRGDPLSLKFQMDTNQCLRLELSLRDQPNKSPFLCQIENPLTLVADRNEIRERIEEREELLRVGKVPRNEIPDNLVDLSEDYFELGHIDKSIDYLKQALRIKGRPDAAILNLLGIRYGYKRDWEQEERMYREASQASPSWATPLFNLALSQFHRANIDAAEKTICEALTIEQDPPYLVLYALILRKQGKIDEAESIIKEAIVQFGPIRALSDWELDWLLTAAKTVSNQALLDSISEEKRRRRRVGDLQGAEQGGLLPEIAPKLQRL